LQRFADDAVAEGRTVIEVDGETIAPENLAAMVGRAVDRPGVVLLIDAFDRCVVVEGWLRRDFLPPASGGRGGRGGEPAAAGSGLAVDLGWTRRCGWSPCARWNLPRRGRCCRAALVCGGPQEAAAAFAVGIRWLWACSRSRRAVDAGGGEVRVPGGRDVIEALLSRLVGQVPSPAHRYALEVCAHAYRTTQELLRAVVPQDADVLFGWLRGLPFVESGPAGLFPHEVSAKGSRSGPAVARSAGVRGDGRRVRDHLLDQTRTAAGKFAVRADGRDLPAPAHGGDAAPVTWQSEGEVREEAYRSADRAAILAMAAGMEARSPRSWMDFWLDRSRPPSMCTGCRGPLKWSASWRWHAAWTRRGGGDRR